MPRENEKSPALYYWKRMEHLEYQPLWRIVKQEDELCTIQGRDSGIIYDNIPLDSLTPADSHDKPQQLFLF